MLWALHTTMEMKYLEVSGKVREFDADWKVATLLYF